MNTDEQNVPEILGKRGDIEDAGPGDTNLSGAAGVKKVNPEEDGPLADDKTLDCDVADGASKE